MRVGDEAVSRGAKNGLVEVGADLCLCPDSIEGNPHAEKNA